MDVLNAWFHWLFPSPEYFLLGVVLVVGLCSFIRGLRHAANAGASQPELEDQQGAINQKSGIRDPEPYDEWHAHQVREQHRIASEQHRRLL